MKKSFVLLVVMIALILGTVYYTQNTLLEEKDQVHFTEHVIYGDKSVVEGVTVDMHNSYQRQLFWHTTYEVGEIPKEETEYQFYSSKQYEANSYYGGDFTVYMNNYGLSLSDFQDETYKYEGIELAWKELYDATDPGEEKQMDIKLKDYQEFYDFGMEISLPQKEGSDYKEYSDISFHFSMEKEMLEEIEALEKSGQQKEKLARVKKQLEDLQNFKAFFKIPVIQEEVYALAIAKDEYGNVIGMSESGASGGSSTGDIDFIDKNNWEDYDAFYLDLRAAFSDGACYLAFDAHTRNGNCVDISLIPGGYGIYRFTYDSKNGTIDSKNLEMVYALDPNVTFSNITMDASGKNILLMTEEKGRFYVSVIDEKTMTLTNKFDVGPVETYFTFWTFEDFMVTYSDTLAVYSVDENGRYAKEWAVDVKDIEEKLAIYENAETVPNYSSGMDWDGEKLLIGNSIYDQYLGRTSNFLLAAIDESGLIYYGKYESTLMTNESFAIKNDDAIATNYMGYTICGADFERKTPVLVKWKK